MLLISAYQLSASGFGLELLSNKNDVALTLYQTVAGSPYRPAAVRGLLEGTLLKEKLGKIKPAEAIEALERLRFSQQEVETVVRLVRLHLRPVFYSSEWSDGAVRRLARDAGAQLQRLMALLGRLDGVTRLLLEKGVVTTEELGRKLDDVRARHGAPR